MDEANSADPTKQIQEKVPSQISYSETNKGNTQWGFSIDEHSHVLQWTKLELMPRSPAKELAVLRNLLNGGKLLENLNDLEREVPKHLTRSANEVIQDFLSRVVKEWQQYMKANAHEVLSEMPLDIVVTYPVSWGYDAINATIGAVRGACHKGIFPKIRDFYIVSEPEACALFTVRDMIKEGHNSLYEGEGFILVDAGGGTVDLASYRIDRISPLKMTMIDKTDGAECGATFIDKAFMEWLEPMLVGVKKEAGRREERDVRLISQDVKTGGHFVFQPLARSLLRDYFESIKENFDTREDRDVQLPSRFEDSERRIWDLETAEGFDDVVVDGVVHLSRAELAAIFDESVSKTLNLIKTRITAIENEKYDGIRLHVSNIFLSGGFANNPYLYKKIKEYAKKQSHIQVQRAKECWTAVVQGAVYKTMGVGSDVATKVGICPRHYGVCLSESYEEWRHLENAVHRDRLNDREIVRDQIVWLVKRGDVILPDSPIKKSINLQGHVTKTEHRRGMSIKVTFVATAAPEAPPNMAELKNGEREIADLLVNLDAIRRDQLREQKKASGWGNYLTADLSVEVEVSSAVKVTVRSGSQVVDSYKTTLNRAVSGQDHPTEPYLDPRRSANYKLLT